MDSSKCCSCCSLTCIFLLIIVPNPLIHQALTAQPHHGATTTLQLISVAAESLKLWPPVMMMSPYYDDADDDIVGDIDDEMGIDEAGDGIMPSPRRSLLWWRRMRRYYLSHAALSANRIPCPPRSGRSYYTHKCNFATDPVHPYNRGCSAC